MKNLSKMIREAADHSFWQQEFERAATSYGLTDQDDRESVWAGVAEMLDSISVLAFDYRLNPDAFVPALKEWHADQRTKLKVLADLTERSVATPAEILLGKITFRLLGQIEFAFEQYELHSRCKLVLDSISPPRLDAASAKSAREISAHLRRAVGKLKNLQNGEGPTGFEFDIYRNILEAAARHFEEMAHSEEPVLKQAA